MIKSALILAAGRGLRMAASNLEKPKGFLQLGDKPIVAESIDKLLASGIERVFIVTGHLAETYQALAAGYGGRVICVHNPNYATQGSLESLRVGIVAVDAPLLLLESDIVYQKRALDVLQAHAEEDILLLSGPTRAGDEVYVWSEPRPEAPPRLVTMSKRADFRPDPHHGELVGILKCSARFNAGMLAAVERTHAANLRSDYEAGLVDLARALPVACVKIDDLVWAEIDDEAMLEHARRSVYPRIAATG